MLQPLTTDNPSLQEANTLRTLNAFAVDLISIPSEEDLFWYVAQNVAGRLNFVDCVIYQANEEQTLLTQVAALGEKNPFGRSIINPLKIPFGHGITGKVAETKRPIIIEDLLKDQNYIPDTQVARSEICVPLTIGNRVVGVIDSEHPDPDRFHETDLEVFTTVAAMTSAKLELLAEADRSQKRYHDLVQSHSQLSEEITNRKVLEAELSTARKLEAVGRLTGKFAHDFNNILTVISGNLEFVAPDVVDAPSSECLIDAQTAADRGAKLIRDMLAFAGRTRLNPEHIDLATLLETACTPLQSDTSTPVDLKVDDDLWPINADRAGVVNALAELIANAKTAMPDGGKVAVTAQNITHHMNDDRGTIDSLVTGKYVEISIADTGDGITHSRLQQIFDPFFTTKSVNAGTGLGLSAVLGFVQQTGGSIAVQSESNQGSVFQVFFPAFR